MTSCRCLPLLSSPPYLPEANSICPLPCEDSPRARPKVYLHSWVEKLFDQWMKKGRGSSHFEQGRDMMQLEIARRYETWRARVVNKLVDGQRSQFWEIYKLWRKTENSGWCETYPSKDYIYTYPSWKTAGGRRDNEWCPTLNTDRLALPAFPSLWPSKQMDCCVQYIQHFIMLLPHSHLTTIAIISRIPILQRLQNLELPL